MLRWTAVCKYKSIFVDEVRVAGKQELAATRDIPTGSHLQGFLKGVIQRMVSGGQLVAAPTVLPKVGQATLYIPLYVCKKSLGEVVSLDHDSNMVFTEEYCVKGVQSRLAGDCSRSVNILTLAESYNKRFTSHATAKKKGAARRGTDPEVTNSKLSANLLSVLEKQKALYQEVLELKQKPSNRKTGRSPPSQTYT